MPFMFIKQQPSHLATLLLFYYLYLMGQFTVAALLLSFQVQPFGFNCDTAHAHKSLYYPVTAHIMCIQKVNKSYLTFVINLLSQKFFSTELV